MKSQGSEEAPGSTPKKQTLVPYETAGPTALSLAPSEPPPDKRKVTQDWQYLRGHLEARLMSLRTWRQTWWSQSWADASEFILPRRSIWLTQSSGGSPSPNNMARGKQINSSIVDPTATYALRVCAAGLMSGLASPSRPWFKLIPSLRGAQIDTDARIWLDDVESRLYTVLAMSNFYNAFAQECEDLVAFGTAPSIVYEDEQDLIRLYNPTVGEYYLASGATMRVDGFYRQFLMTISQIVEFFGVENCPEEIRKMWEMKGAGLELERIVAHSIEPNFELKGGSEGPVGKVPGKFAWREVYWVFGAASKGPLSVRGFVDQPFTASRWSTQSNDAYGRGPGADVLPDVMQLQVMTRRKAEAIEKMVRPPMLADMQLKNQPSSILPGHVTYVSGLGQGTGMRPIYEVNPDVGALSADIAQIQARIKVGLFNDLFLMLEQVHNARMTAYEVAQKMQEKLQVLGPVIEGLLSESLKPKLKRIFGILVRKGMIDPPPESMRGLPLEFSFVSMLALAQKAAATAGMERLVQIVGSMVAVYPEIKDNVDPDAFIREFNELLGNSQKMLRGPEQVDKIRKAAAAAQMKAQKMMEQQHSLDQMQKMGQTAQTGAQAANVLSQTDVGGGANALAMMLGRSQGGLGQ